MLTDLERVRSGKSLNTDLKVRQIENDSRPVRFDENELSDCGAYFAQAHQMSGINVLDDC
jgi:hypothetical protein